MPTRVVELCDGLLKRAVSFCKYHMNSALDEFEAVLNKDAERLRSGEAHSEQMLYLRNLKRAREQVLAICLADLEARLAGIRDATVKPAPGRPGGLQKASEGLALVDDGLFEQHQLLSGMAARCESHNGPEMHSLRQRFSVLAGKSPFSNDELPLGPAVLCECLLASVRPLQLDIANTETLFAIFEKRALGNYRKLLEDCNAYLAERGVLANLNFTTFRNPELRFKKSPIALEGGHSAKAAPPSLLAATDSGKVPESHAVGSVAPATSAAASPAQREYRFDEFRELLAKKKRLLSDFDSALNKQSAAIPSAHAVAASRDAVNVILGELQLGGAAKPMGSGGVKAIKHQIQAQLLNQSTEDRQLTLAEEDSDAIDMFGMLMETAMQKLKPESATSQLMAMLQTPLVRVVLQDKSFFENQSHPGRRMLDTLAETGMNWLDVADRDEKLYTNVLDIVTGMSKDFDGDNQRLQAVYEETNRLLQTLVKKAEAIERRQIDVAKGRERLSIARTRAEETMAELIADRRLRDYTRAILLNAWTDVMVLTELRNGADSQSWQAQKRIAESLIAVDDPSMLNSGVPAADLAPQVQESLQLVGYHPDEAVAASNRLLNAGSLDDSAMPAPAAAPERLGEGSKQTRAKPVFDLDARQRDYVEQIKLLPFGSWFEFMSDAEAVPERRKMAWVSHVTHHMLFVNPRGQNAADMLIEELAIEMSAGRARILEEDRRGFITRTLDSVYSSLKDILPGLPGGKA